MQTVLALLISLGLLGPGATLEDIPDSWGASWGEDG